VRREREPELMLVRMTEALGAAVPRRQLQPDEDATLQKRKLSIARSAQHFA